MGESWHSKCRIAGLSETKSNRALLHPFSSLIGLFDTRQRKPRASPRAGGFNRAAHSPTAAAMAGRQSLLSALLRRAVSRPDLALVWFYSPEFFFFFFFLLPSPVLFPLIARSAFPLGSLSLFFFVLAPTVLPPLFCRLYPCETMAVRSHPLPHAPSHIDFPNPTQRPTPAGMCLGIFCSLPAWPALLPGKTECSATPLIFRREKRIGESASLAASRVQDGYGSSWQAGRAQDTHPWDGQLFQTQMPGQLARQRGRDNSWRFAKPQARQEHVTPSVWPSGSFLRLHESCTHTSTLHVSVAWRWQFLAIDVPNVLQTVPNCSRPCSSTKRLANTCQLSRKERAIEKGDQLASA